MRVDNKKQKLRVFNDNLFCKLKRTQDIITFFIANMQRKKYIHPVILILIQKNIIVGRVLLSLQNQLSLKTPIL